MATSVMNLVIQTERSSIYYPTEKPVIVTTTVDVNVDVSIDPHTEEVIITITNANSLTPSDVPIITNVNYATDNIFVVENNNIYQYSLTNLRENLYTAGSHINITGGVINFDTSTSVNFITIPTSPTPSPGDNSTNVATTAFVNNAISAIVSGLIVKDAVNLLATSNLNLSMPGAITIDGVSPIVGWRLGLIGQTNAAQNGTYIWNGPANALIRSPDANSSAEVSTGLFFFVSLGVQWADSGWILNTPAPIILDTTPLNFTQFTGAADINVTTGLTKVGNTIGIDFTIVAPLNTPTFTGTPTAPTVSISDNSTKLATTAFVVNYVAAQGFAPLNSPAFIGTPTGPTPTIGTNTSRLATTSFVNSATDGVVTINSTGGSITLVSTQYGVPILIVTGVLLSNATLVVPNNGWWIVANRTTGAFSLTIQTSLGSGVIVDQTYDAIVMADGTNVVFAQTDFNAINLLGNCTAVTQPVNDNSTNLATTAFVISQLGQYLPIAGGEITGSLIVDHVFTAVGAAVAFNPGGANFALPQFNYTSPNNTSMSLSDTSVAIDYKANSIIENDSGVFVQSNGGSGSQLYVADTNTGFGNSYFSYLTTRLTLYPDHAQLNATLDMVGFGIINVLDPVNPQDAATKNYVDSVIQGLDVKASVRLLATSDINIANPGAITIDSVTPNIGDRIGLVGETDATTNGLYTWNGSGNPLTRTLDANTSNEVKSGMFFWVTGGTANGDTGWILTTADPIILDTTPLSFSQFSGAAQISAGTGLTKTGNVISVNFAIVAALISPTFTGTPLAPTAIVSTNTTQIATTAFVVNYVAAQNLAPLNSPQLTGTPVAPTATVNTNTTQIATTAFVLAQIAGSTITYAQLPAELSNAIASIFFATLSTGQPVYIPITQAMRLPVNLSGSIAYCGTLPVGSPVFNIGYLRAGVLTAVNTFTFTSASHSGTLSTNSLVNLLVGDMLVITQPTPTDASLANVGISIVMTKQ